MVKFKDILVVGGAGFLGSNLVTKLLQDENNRVYVIDDYSTGRASNLVKHLANPNFYLGTVDILKDLKHAVTVGNWSEKYLYDVAFDEIYHLASPASPPKYQIDPIRTFRINTEGTLNLLELARRSNARLLFASTSETYGDPTVHPQTEDYRGNVSTTGPRACYDESKRGGETLCIDHARQYGTKVLIPRIFNTYGPGMDPNDGRVVSNLICQMLQGKKLTVFGTGKQTRSFCYVDDLIDGFVKLMASDCYSTPVNLGNPNEFTILELLEEIGKHRKGWSWDYAPLPADDPRQRNPDISLARKRLGWEPKVQLREGLAKTIAYFEKEIKKTI
jgi:UDP-glucuronate decarboxylase